MAHETPTVKVQPRERHGSRYAQRLRKEGRLPAVIYGHQTDPVSVSVDAKEIVGIIAEGAHALNVAIEGGTTETCLVKDLQFGYLGDNVIHVDFARVRMDEEVEVNVHLRFIGEAPESLKANAMLVHDSTELEVRCKVAEIPSEIVVDLSKMEGTSITADEIEMPPGSVLVDSADTVVASVQYVLEEEAEGEEAEVAAEGAEPEVIAETKDDDDKGGDA